jgi:hypothetical protein
MEEKRKRTPKEVCESKKRYVDRISAEIMLTKYRILNKGKKRAKGKTVWENHAYLCYVCKGWHLTSKLRKD